MHVTEAGAVAGFVSWLLNVPATCLVCILTIPASCEVYLWDESAETLIHAATRRQKFPINFAASP